MFLYGFYIIKNAELNELKQNDVERRHVIFNYYTAPYLNSYASNAEEIQHYYLGNKVIIYNRKGQLLDISEKSIDFYSKTDVPNIELEYIASIGAFPYLIRLNNMIALHGAALTYKNKAIIILGKSGSWKSTLTFALACKLKESIISDDLIAVATDNEHIYRGISKIRLFEQNYKIIKKYILDNHGAS